MSSGANTTVKSEKDLSKSKKIACVECRQQKAKCDAHETAPGPCTRCKRRNLPCELKSDYKRTYKRAKIAQLEKEYEVLRQRLHGDPQSLDLLPHMNALSPLPPHVQPPIISQQARFVSPTPSPIPVAAKTVPNSGPVVIRNNVEPTFFGTKGPDPVPVPCIHIDPSLYVCQPKSLGDVHLSEEQIKALFGEYVERYHPILPVVDVFKGVEKLYKLCPVLFWTIMYTSLRKHQSAIISREESSSLYFALSPILKSALAELAISPITRYAPAEMEEAILNVSSVHSVQALLIFTFWPPLKSSLSADASWNSIGMAIFQAIRIGLHVPGHSPDGMKTTNMDLLQEQVRTWLCCNAVSQTIGTAFGFPSFVQLDTSLLMSCKPNSSFEISESLRQMVEIQLFEDSLAKTMNSNPLDPLRLVDATERLPLLHLLHTQLDQLEIKLLSDFANPVDDIRRLTLYAARLHISTYYFLDTDRIAPFELIKGMTKAYNAALAVILHCKDAQARDKGFMKYMPGVHVLTMWQAAFIIARLVHSTYSSFVDVGAGKEAYQSAIDLVFKASVVKHDMAHRSSGIMRSLWPLLKTLHEQGDEFQKVTVRSRMAASVFFDCLWILREKSGMIKLAPRQDASNLDGVVADGESESDEYDEAVNSGSDSEERAEESNGKDSQRTPNSSVSSQSRRRRKQRSLSNTLHPESSARKIINTIPLDPQPISLAEKQGHTSGTNSTNTSPFMHQYRSPPNHATMQPPPVKNVQTAEPKTTATNPVQYPLDSWEMVSDLDSELLFKNIDTVMDVFGFHTE
ncbi:hypothetical protein OGAPHI_004404 [Ogataea philodendri]|uniref:Zn(2)-C6 fungal-type domain-containing protein n=1 Tax=Ogataea philodendri TaxID=1378263 RepID=A0A9P8T5L7_9ASCO|nr:uncharacterized protein OGAPHI_004404 [Ogataea philodendri]KAH3666215.1 hypothetical protein OGAPHI_004404 [Ogataea philodendri]